MSDKPAPPARQPGIDGAPGAPMGDLRAYVAIVRRRKWSLILVTLITVAAAAAFSYRQTPMYRSTESVQVKPLDPAALQGGYTYNFGISMTTEQALAAYPAVADLAHKAAAQSGVTSPDDGSLSTDVPTDTPILDITYSGADPVQARDWAHAYAQGYILYRAQQAIDNYDSAKKSYDDQIAPINAELDDLRSQLATASKAEAAGIQQAITQNEALVKALTNQKAALPYPVTSTAAESIATATVPSAPYSPNWVRNMALALLAGLALGFAVVFVRERLDDRLGGREDLEDAAGAPVLAIVPHIGGWKKKSTTKLVAKDAPKTSPAEAYRTLRTNVAFMAHTNELKMISMVSPSMGEGKTTTTANLAVALAQSGKRVVALSCDLRKPRLHRFFGLSNDVGVTSVLRDGVSVPEAAQRVGGIDTLRVIASGPVPHDPAELLGSEEMEEMLADLRKYADYVLVDTAPVLVVSDALSVAPKTDGVIIMVDSSSTMRGAVKATREQLELVGANIVGAVFNNFDPSRAKMYSGSYRYHYYSSYTYQDKPDRVRGRKAGNAADLWK